ncbi:hypothetical protein ACJRO7_024664 [Eucalyptus globulus]|uniref:Uncharacterized protein n=1 Tax=Eucalyptus globulus TaxID=34317 RepID=A0ABD3KAE6_EUCGL
MVVAAFAEVAKSELAPEFQVSIQEREYLPLDAPSNRRKPHQSCTAHRPLRCGHKPQPLHLLHVHLLLPLGYHSSVRVCVCMRVHEISLHGETENVEGREGGTFVSPSCRGVLGRQGQAAATFGRVGQATFYVVQVPIE